MSVFQDFWQALYLTNESGSILDVCSESDICKEFLIYVIYASLAVNSSIRQNYIPKWASFECLTSPGIMKFGGVLVSLALETLGVRWCAIHKKETL